MFLIHVLVLSLFSIVFLVQEEKTTSSMLIKSNAEPATNSKHKTLNGKQMREEIDQD